MVEGLVGPRSASRGFFSHGDGGLGWLRGWLVPVLRRGCFLATVGWSVTLELKSGKTRISAPAHSSATGIGRVSGLVFPQLVKLK